MSQPTSPLLHNSSFSQFDYFATGERLPIFTLSLTSSPSSSTSSPQFQCTPERSRASSPCPTNTEGSSGEPPQLGSPRVLSSPKLTVRKDSDLARKSVQFGEKAAVNWARPLRVEQDPSTSVRIFGASLQRSRRLNRSPMPSPSSSDDEPLTPSPVTPSGDDSVQVPLRGWSVFSSAKGLGVSGVAEWDTPVTPLRELPDFAFEPLDLSPTTSSTTPPKRAAGVPKPSAKSSLPRSQSQAYITPSISNARILATSRSLNSFSSPSNLEELRSLRQAAVILENEVRRPIKTSLANREGPRDKKIKRKAVPSIIEADLLETPISTTATSTPSANTGRSYPQIQPRRSSLMETDDVPRGMPGLGDSIFSRQRQLYQNHLASQSVTDFSPRPRSTPDVPTGISPRINSTPPTTSISQFRILLNESSSNASSASSLSDQPLTPTSLSASQTEYFLNSVETAFKKLEMERAAANGQKERISGALNGKHKRAFSRFLGK